MTKSRNKTEKPVIIGSQKKYNKEDVDWGAFVSALNGIRYDSCAVIEVEGKAFEGSREDILKSICLSRRYLDQFII